MKAHQTDQTAQRLSHRRALVQREREPERGDGGRVVPRGHRGRAAAQRAAAIRHRRAHGVVQWKI